MKKIRSFILSLAVILNVFALEPRASGMEADNGKVDNNIVYEGVDAPEISAVAAVLMDASTGTVLYTKNASEALPPASVTKIMTLLLVAEAIDDGRISIDEKVRVSAEAASKGGSQIFIKEGEEFTVEELLKSTVIASANDAAVALAELVSGSEDSFVDQMNKRAKELGMTNTSFENATGLDDTVEHHLISAYDIAIMSRELIKYDIITKYSRIWQDTIRDGEFVLTNTNRLVRFYDGCTGLKTGSTDKAGFCVSATAERNGMHLIAVIMGAETRDDRNNAARALLDYGFANYGVYTYPKTLLENIPVFYGKSDYVMVYSKGFSKLVSKGDKNQIESEYIIPEKLTAPLNEGEKVGEIVFKLDGKIIGKSDVCTSEKVERIGIAGLYARILRTVLTGK